MKRIKSKKISLIIMCLVLIEISSIFLMWKSLNNKEIYLDEVKLKEVSKSSMFAIMLEQTGGGYTPSEDNAWPTNMYFNETESVCIDNSGNKIEDSLSYNSENNTVLISTNSTSYCYLYFDLESTSTSSSLADLCTSGSDLGSCLTTNVSKIDNLSDSGEGGLYRYQGTDVNNYICFGTTDKEECVNNTDAYMYRIMGINENNEVKLIKKEALNEAIAWYSDNTTNISWPQSTIYSSINGDSFLNNTTYVPSGWSDKITETEWKYGDVNNGTNSYLDYSASELYEIENGWTEKTEPTKIGLMYAHDYYYGISGGLNCKYQGSDYTTCKTSWIHLSNSDTSASSMHEWTMSRYGARSDGNYIAWRVTSIGTVDDNILGNAYSVRPVFFLNSDEKYISGTGTIDDPIILSEPELVTANTIGSSVMEMSTTGLNTSMEGGLYRYQGTTANNYICFGTTSKDTCTGDFDTYMYRIIGITESGELKVIKQMALNSASVWYNHGTYGEYMSMSWNSSTLYTAINGSTYLNNTSLMPNGWSDKIVSKSWKYGDNKIYNTTALELYNKENAWTSEVSAKIGLMYLHDYYYGMNGGNNCSTSASTCKTSWLHLANNDTTPPNTTERTMSGYGNDGEYQPYYGSTWPAIHYHYSVNTSGAIVKSKLNESLSVRPVFYISANEILNGGTGTGTDPFLIK